MNNELILEIKTQVTDTNQKIKELVDNINGTGKAIDNARQKASSFTKAFSFGSLVYAGQRITREFMTFMDAVNDYTESLNLYNVVLKNTDEQMSELGKTGIKFQNTMAQNFGLQRSQTLTYQALYQSMAENMGIASDKAYIMSENTTKLVNDLSSLYNKSEATTAEALRAGIYAGQTKPLRSYGLDVTERSLQPILDRLQLTDSEGENLTVRQLNQAEKQILRYMAVLEQSKVAHRDWANTIESPTNQLRVFKNQLIEAKVALGALFQGAFAKILPYANAILMVITEISKAIASMFGIKLSDYNTSVGTFEGIGDSVDDVGTSVADTTDKVKKLKREILSFDEVHNIDTDTGDSSSSGGGGGSYTGSGINQELLDAIKGYDNGMESVRMKATEIRDKIMEWLGFTKEIDPLTGKVSFKFSDTNSSLYRIVQSLKEILTVGIKIVKDVLSIMWEDFKNGAWGDIIADVLEAIGDALKWIDKNKAAKNVIAKILELMISYKALKLIPGVKQLLGLVEKLIRNNTSLSRGITSLFSPLKNLRTSLDNVNYSGKTTFQGLSEGLNNWSKSLTTIDKAKLTITGLATSFISLSGVSSIMKDISNNGINMANSLGLVASGVGAIAGGAQLGSIFGSWGTVIGGVVGGLGALSIALNSIPNEYDKISKSVKDASDQTKELVKSIKDERNSIEENLSSQLTNIDAHQKLYDELLSIVDANGKVKDGYQERANFIVNELNNAYGTEYQVVDGIITKYAELKDNINNLIQAKKAEIILNAKEEEYLNAWDNRQKLYKSMIDNENKLKEAKEAQVKALKELEEGQRRFSDGSVSSNMQLGKLRKNYQKATESVEKMTEAYNSSSSEYQNCVNDIITYEELLTASTNENYDKINQVVEQSSYTWTENGKLYTASLTNRIGEAKKYADERVRIAQENGNTISEVEKNQYYNSYNQLVNSLAQQTAEVKDGKYSSELKDAWKYLAQNNYELYSEKLAQMTPTMREQIQSITGVVVEKTPEVENATDELMRKVIESMEKSDEAKAKGLNLVQSLLNGLSDSSKRQLLKQCGVQNVDEVMNGLKQGNFSETVGMQIIQGLISGLKNNYWQGVALNTAFYFASGLLNKFKEVFDINSPSKKTESYGAYLIQGFSLGIDDEKNKALSKISNFSQDVLSLMDISDKNLSSGKIDVSSAIDYSVLDKSINTKFNANINSNVVDNLAKAISVAINDKQINVNINARTEKGTIVETAIEGINDIKRRTGNSPIEVL